MKNAFALVFGLLLVGCANTSTVPSPTVSPQAIDTISTGAMAAQSEEASRAPSVAKPANVEEHIAAVLSVDAGVVSVVTMDAAVAAAAGEAAKGTIAARTPPARARDAGAPPRVDAAVAPAGDLAAATAIYARACGRTCHPGGNAGDGPAIRRKNWLEARMRTQIRNGAGDMPAIRTSRLTDADLATMMVYLRSIGAVRR